MLQATPPSAPAGESSNEIPFILIDAMDAGDWIALAALATTALLTWVTFRNNQSFQDRVHMEQLEWQKAAHKEQREWEQKMEEQRQRERKEDRARLQEENIPRIKVSLQLGEVETRRWISSIPRDRLEEYDAPLITRVANIGQVSVMLDEPYLVTLDGQRLGTMPYQSSGFASLVEPRGAAMSEYSSRHVAEDMKELGYEGETLIKAASSDQADNLYESKLLLFDVRFFSEPHRPH